jgi:hypothetical protein
MESKGNVFCCGRAAPLSPINMSTTSVIPQPHIRKCRTCLKQSITYDVLAPIYYVWILKHLDNYQLKEHFNGEELR